MYKLQVDFLTVQNQQPHPPVVQGSTIYCFFFFFLVVLYDLRDLSSPIGVKPVPPEVKVWSPNHWKSPTVYSFMFKDMHQPHQAQS